MQFRLKFCSILASKLCTESQTHIKEILTFPLNSPLSCGTTLYIYVHDLDSPQNCPPQLIWIRAPLNPGFFLRVAVMEVESWIMADRSALAGFLSIPDIRFRLTQDISNPKEFLVSLARRSNRRRLRDQLSGTRGDNRKSHTCVSKRTHWNALLSYLQV